MSGQHDSTRVSKTVRFVPLGLGVATAALMVALGSGWPAAAVVAAVGLIAFVVLGRRTRGAPDIDAFSVGEPWRQFVQGAQRSANRLADTVDRAEPGPLKDRMASIVDRLDTGLVATWRIARRGNEIDTMIRRLDPTSLASKLATLERRAQTTANSDLAESISSVRSQLESVDRLRAESERTADRLRLTQTRLDELVARAAEIAIGAGDTDAYEHDVDDLVVELEAIRLAVEETNGP